MDATTHDSITMRAELERFLGREDPDSSRFATSFEAFEAFGSDGLAASEGAGSEGLGGAFAAPDVLAVLAPSGIDDAAALLRFCHATRIGVLPAGGGTALRHAPAVARPAIVLSTRRLTGVVDYPRADMTITVRAGTTRAELDRVLQEGGQHLPVEAGHPERATIGGMLATNASGAKRLGLGTLRDALLGVTAIDGTGRMLRSGGRVVKNVAGYDLGKLFIGSWGSLVLLVEATFKLAPVPRARAWLVFAIGAADLPAMRGVLLRGEARPIACELLSGTASALLESAPPGAQGDSSTSLVACAVEGSEVEVRWQLDALRRSVVEHVGSSPIELCDVDADRFSRVLVEHQTAGDAWVRGAVRPGRVAELVERLEYHRFGSVASDAVEITAVVAGIGTGVVTVRVHGDVSEARRALDRVFTELGGHLTFPAPSPAPPLAPPPAPSPAPPPAPSPGHTMTSVRDLTLGLKSVFDPQGVLPAVPGTNAVAVSASQARADAP